MRMPQHAPFGKHHDMTDNGSERQRNGDDIAIKLRL